MDLESRLVRRYHQLVKSHMSINNLLTAGIKSTLEGNEAFNQTQAAWRFFNNERCELTELIKPIKDSALNQSERLCVNYNLIAHDWSGLIYKKHTNKKDRFGVHHEKELGYELQASLLLNDKNGCPIAPIALNVVTKTEVLSTYRKESSLDETHLEELAKRVNYIETLGFKKPLVHIVDREGDSVQLMRILDDKKWLLRSRSNSCISHQGTSLRVDKLAEQLIFTHSRMINYKGQKAEQFLSEAEITITRESQPKKKMDGKRHKIKGEAVKCRLIVSRVEKEGKVLAWWYLVTNVKEVCMADIALWYYWRWSIESFFKLLKSAGMQLESWQQETGKAIARRLLVACMACVYVWQLAETEGPEAGELKKLLIRLSGRQMKYGVDFTRPALFAGLASLLNALDVFNKYEVNNLRQMLLNVMGEALV